MKKNTEYYAIIFVILILISCSTTNKQLQGRWLVEEIIKDSRNLIWEEQMITSLRFNSDGTCKLPVRDLSKSNNAKWEVNKKEKIYYLTISGAQDSLFNGQYKLIITEKQQLSSMVKILELQSNQLYMKCTQ